ncbi:hypothetical protein BC792_108117 [Sphingobacterium allocomposti]|uniref:PKD family protein n=1 Tax=Sphingobacterium allocomposti TaxID=415956 RepID=A0A5S5DK33_9SPHI|nr:hypothetical protein [Sphingobacterium composti Yoo et al. 2007 non Ten et al. 2007]TYP96025.1 hypothetical protein BC792_108117 [Sphingobacterium composti Yoo et al. 2007 non Ten et al. 2007]
MKKLTNIVRCSVSFLFILFYASSCKKDAVFPDDGRESYTVGFKFKEFEQILTPLQTRAAQRASANTRATTASTENVREGLIYYWSFNAETLLPDLYPTTGSSITYNGGSPPMGFSSGWRYEDYAAGSALSMTGLTELIIKMPLNNVRDVQTLAFDISSSGTGPKSFALWWTQDGTDYRILAEDNQFSNTNTPQSRNAFSYDLSGLSLDLTKPLYIKLIPKAGSRGTAGDYRETTGVTKVDNFRLYGAAQVSSGSSIRRLHYHIFDVETKTCVMAGATDINDDGLTDFTVSLPEGEYVASFAANISDATLLIPGEVAADSYYLANVFANHQAKIYGVLDTFAVSKDMQLDVILKRYYSEIKFEFTDSRDLSRVEKLVVKRQREPVFYAPFNPMMANPIQDMTEIVVHRHFDEGGKEFVFHQFLGGREVALPISYLVEAYDGEGILLRSFTVDSAIPNNVQLVFRGKLLDAAHLNAGFQVRLNETWDGSQIVEFE